MNGGVHITFRMFIITLNISTSGTRLEGLKEVQIKNVLT